MNNSLIKVASGVPNVTLTNVTENIKSIKELIIIAEKEGVQILCLPELCISGYTCGDLFFNALLLCESKNAVIELANFCKDKKITVIVGFPLEVNGKLYNCAAVLHNGKILKIIPKTDIPSPRFSDQSRYFESGNNIDENSFVTLSDGFDIPFNNTCFKIGNCSFSVIIGDSIIRSGFNTKYADIILNVSAINQIAGRTEQTRKSIKNACEKLGCGYILSSCGLGESTTDTVYAGLLFIAQSGEILKEKAPFSNEKLITYDIDTKNNFKKETLSPSKSTETIERNPFLPTNVERDKYLEEILQIQSYALARRIEHTHSKKAVIGISGGLDSTLALLVCERAMKILNRQTTDILTITMPCFGTTIRTRNNSEILCKELGVEFREINIKKSVLQHFEDIGQSNNVFDITYENSQARERTQVLMDIANKENGIVIGTGDLSELALGWATYNGDHMSMYGVNAGIPKTLIRELVEYEAQGKNITLKNVLFDILATPVSPELLPSDAKGEITQKTEDLVGPYELHDFFIYHMIGLCEEPQKIYNSAISVFPEYTKETIKKWLFTFTRRFFIQQFKRSCLPDGPSVCDISLSPRAGFKMPTDASFELWIKQIEKL